jgi:hypothetical protein
MFEAWKSLYNWLMPRMASGLSEETLTEAAIKGSIEPRTDSVIRRKCTHGILRRIPGIIDPYT